MVLSIKNASVIYPASDGRAPVAALQSIDLTLQNNDFVVALGASGCGKSTLLNLIAGFLSPSSGEILLDGKTVTGPGADRSVVFQKHALLPWLNVLENVAFGLKIRKRPKAEVTEQEYKDFYRHVSHDWTDPLRSIPVRMEGTFEAYALLFLPEKAPFDLYSPEMKRGLQLYVKRVFVMDECKELLPTHLRFVRGVVDAHDLSLNVSREILQKDRQIQLIKKQLVKRVLGALDEMKRDKPDDYRTFWTAFGPVLKEGLAGWDTQDKDKLLDLVVTHSTQQPDGLVAFADYVGRMKEGQDAIYYLTGASKDAVARSPLLERFAKAGYEDAVASVRVGPEAVAEKHVVLKELLGEIRFNVTPADAEIRVDAFNSDAIRCVDALMSVLRF